ncbi:hypothetical protein LCL99_02215 [Halomonas denitrificans]|uniref:hypothetical protein n=1 Tax=Halomonas TaxID=2745 RepID=UPI001A8F5EDE|nr:MULTISPECIES: hypothetical protein [Halomonas]MBN8414371.1 hypothetical protein [Halomonas litopenaei]MCA0973279.1 hypothetical protein [Halomonas denitrificans]
MALDRTAGFDMLVQVSEDELNNQLATAFLAGGIFPPSISVPVNAGGVSGSADLNFDTPVADLDRPRPAVGLTLPFSDSQLQITAPLPLTVAPIGGAITVVDRVAVMTEGSNQLVTMDFNAGAPAVSVAFDPASATLLGPLLSAAGLSLAQAQNMMAGIVLDQLQTSIGRLDLTPPIPVVDDDDATTVFDIDVTTVNDTSALDRDCLAFGVRMSSDGGGNINNVTSSMIPAGSESLVMMSNFWLLARVMRTRIAASLGRPVSDFDTPLRLNRSIPAPGGEGTLRNLEARIIGNRISVTGRATDSGTGWLAESNFSFFIDIGLDGGAITVTATTPVVDTDVDLAWWVWLASLGLGGLFGGIVGVIVAAVVLAIVEAVAEGIADGLISDGLSGAIGGLPAIPLGPIGGGLTLTDIVLDDLELRSNIVRSVSVPVKHQGGHVAAGGFSLDLDTGIVSPELRPGADLAWHPQSGLSAAGGSGLSVTGISFGALTPVQISRLPLATQQIPLGLIPFTYPPGFPVLPHHDVVFGMRTSEGRLAKLRAWRSIIEAGALNLSWVTFDTPTPSLDIAARWTVGERGKMSTYTTRDCASCRAWPVSRRGIFEAWPRLVAFPVDYEWCLCGQVLEQGDGKVEHASGAIVYRLKGRRLEIKTQMAQSIDCELCVSAIDAHGRELYTCIQLHQPGIERRCRPCDPTRKDVAFDFKPVAAALADWRPLFAVLPTYYQLDTSA